mmetsp:Transcript_37539/g.74532  ORF Transcript_37539/g.74532 Transcript_37539/m.74532 type:complete len:208 (+) Transcript_37539:1030-1653(+)
MPSVKEIRRWATWRQCEQQSMRQTAEQRTRPSCKRSGIGSTNRCNNRRIRCRADHTSRMVLCRPMPSHRRSRCLLVVLVRLRHEHLAQKARLLRMLRRSCPHVGLVPKRFVENLCRDNRNSRSVRIGLNTWRPLSKNWRCKWLLARRTSGPAKLHIRASRDVTRHQNPVAHLGLFARAHRRPGGLWNASCRGPGASQCRLRHRPVNC